MAWESTTHRCSLPSDQMTGGKGVGSVWVCDEGTAEPGGCGRRWRIADRVDERVRWVLVPTRGSGSVVVNDVPPTPIGVGEAVALRLRL